MPTSRPYNVPQHLTTPTYDGSGNTVHVDVVDMRLHGWSSWRGYRFWMAHTPYPNSNDLFENPSILASHDGIIWEKPAGLARDPLYTRPSEKWNSDTDLTYDPVADELVLLFRRYEGGLQRWMYARSGDGRSWPTQALWLPGWSQPGEEAVSPALTRLPSGGWAVFAFGVTDPRTMYRWTAPTPTGPFSSTPDICSGMGLWAWHLDVIEHQGRLLALVDEGRERGWMPTDPQGLIAATSTDDGLTWTRNPDPIIALTDNGTGWDSFDLYRGGFQPHDNRVDMRVWYCGRKGTGPVDSWHVGLTHVPLSEWPT